MRYQSTINLHPINFGQVLEMLRKNKYEKYDFLELLFIRKGKRIFVYDAFFEKLFTIKDLERE